MTILDFFVKKTNKSSEICGVEIRRSSKRSKTISLKIKDGKPILSCPRFINDNYLRKLILKKRGWIDSNINKKKEEIIFKQAWMDIANIYDSSDWYKELKTFILARCAQEREIERLGKEYDIEVESKMVSIIQAKTQSKRSNAKFQEVCRRS